MIQTPSKDLFLAREPTTRKAFCLWHVSFQHRDIILNNLESRMQISGRINKNDRFFDLTPANPFHKYRI